MKHKVLLIVNDGWGIAPPSEGNYLEQASTPFFDKIIKEYPHCQNESSGNAVGLPEGAQGNSEVGHLHLGAGRVVWQMLELINRSIKDGSFFENKVLIEAMDRAKGRALHLLGLCSRGEIHADIDHLYALLEMAKYRGVEKVYIHFVADGRDVPERSAIQYAIELQNRIDQIGVGKIVTLAGRYYTMDRDNNWDRTRAGYDVIVNAKGYNFSNIEDAINSAYDRGVETDYYIEPSVIGDYAGVSENDVVFIYNYRTDRPRQITRALSDVNLDSFDRGILPYLEVYTMTRYDETFVNKYAFDEPIVDSCLSDVISSFGLKQLKISESDKRPHVTFFFNAQHEDPYIGEDRISVPSPKVPSYDQTPDMSAYEVRDKTVEAIRSRKYDFILVNFANADLVGHSADKEAIIRAVETVDVCNRDVVLEAIDNNYVVIFTSDHGNAEDKLYQDGSPKPSHTTNPVPCVLISSFEELKMVELKNGSAVDVAPTILDLMGIDVPVGMTGKSLIVR